MICFPKLYRYFLPKIPLDTLNTHELNSLFNFKYALCFLILPPFFNLFVSYQTSDPLLRKIQRIQTIFGFSLVFLALGFFLAAKRIPKAQKILSVFTAILDLLNILGSYELNMAYATDLDQDDQYISNFAVLCPRIIPAVLLTFSFHTWMVKSVLAVVISSYFIIRISPSFLLGSSIAYAAFATLILMCLFYQVEKGNKMKSSHVTATTLHEKLKNLFFDTIPDGIMVLDDALKPIYMNPGMKSLFGGKGTEEGIIQRLKDFHLDRIFQDLQKQQCESPFASMSSPNSSPIKYRETSAPFSKNFSDTIKLVMDRSTPSQNLIKLKASKIDLSVPSMYLDDLKQKRKSSKKISPKDSQDDINNYWKDNSIFMDSSPKMISNLSKNTTSIRKEISSEAFFKIPIDNERFKGYMSKPIMSNGYTVFNICGDLYVSSSQEQKSKEELGESDYVAYEIKHQEIVVDHQSYTFLIISDIIEKEKVTNLEESTRYKNLMFASISHEFRTPANAVLGFLQSASKELKDQRMVRNHIKPALDNTCMLMFLIDDMLDYSNMLVNKFVLSLNSFPVKDCVEEVFNLFNTQAAQRGLFLKTKIHKNAPSRIRSDKRRVQQILVNLLSNAIKFTKKGGVEVSIEGVRHTTSCIKISVRDTGVGLKPTDAKRLTLTMNDSHTYRKISNYSAGVGMGLMMTQSLALAVGPPDDIAPDVAGIVVDTQFGRGSLFELVVYNHEVICTLEEEIFTVPTMPDEHSPDSKKDTFVTTFFDPRTGLSHPHFAHSASYTSSPRRTFTCFPNKKPHEEEEVTCSCPKVLIVDDYHYNLMALQSQLNQFGVKSDTAIDGQEAIKKVVEEHNNRKGCCEGYKVIFMDYNMPVMNGAEATRELTKKKAAKEISDVAIIGCSAYTDAEHMEKGIAAGMSEFVTKPVARETLEILLKKYNVIEEK